MGRSLGDRFVSEGAGVAVLVLLTMIVTASVGISVLFIDDESEGVQANFSFEYRSDAQSLTVTHAQGDEFPAGDLVIENQRTNVTWAEAANWSESRTVSQGDIILLSENSPYGQPVGSSDSIQIVYDPEDGNRTVLDNWSGQDETGF